MQKSTYDSLNKHLSKLEKNIAKISYFQEKGYTISTSLQDVYLDIRNVGDYLKGVEDDNQEELAEINAKYKSLLVKFDTLANQASPQAEGKVMASDNTLPELIYGITSRYPAICLFFEKVVTILGIGMVAFTLLGMTYFLAVGNIPFLKTSGGITSGIDALILLIGVILGLLVHEFAHAVILANNGIKIVRIGVIAGSIVGGFVEADEDTFLKADPQVHLRFNASSIGTNALLTIILAISGLLISSDILVYLALGNLFFGFINSFPISPLDGGWVYEDLVKLYLNHKKVKEIVLGARFVIFIIWIILFIRLVLTL